MLAADRSGYETGEGIVAHLSNDGEGDISFSWCDLSLERLEIEGWAEFPLTPRTCELALHVLEPGREDVSPLLLDSPLPAATYRLLLSIREDDFTETTVLRSAPFTVAIP